MRRSEVRSVNANDISSFISLETEDQHSIAYSIIKKSDEMSELFHLQLIKKKEISYAYRKYLRMIVNKKRRRTQYNGKEVSGSDPQVSYKKIRPKSRCVGEKKNNTERLPNDFFKELFEKSLSRLAISSQLSALSRMRILKYCKI